MLSLFHFSFEDRASLLQPLLGLLLRGLFEDYRWHVLSADAWLPWDYMTSTRFAMNEPRDGHIPSFTLVKESKLKR